MSLAAGASLIIASEDGRVLAVLTAKNICDNLFGHDIPTELDEERCQHSSCAVPLDVGLVVFGTRKSSDAFVRARGEKTICVVICCDVALSTDI